MITGLVLSQGYVFEISVQIIVGVMVYFIMLIVLKDDYVYKFLSTVKNKIGIKG